MKFSTQFDAFHEQASAAAGGLTDFGARDYEEPLRVMLDDFDHAAFGDAGTQMKIGDVVGNLATRLLTQQGFKDYPAFANAAVDKPLIICGLPRTGTTVLHRMIGLDPDTQALQQWLGSSPMPRPPRDTWEDNPRYQRSHQLMKMMNELMPTLWSLHPMVAAEPDECHFAIGQSFCTPDRACTAAAPRYSTWLHGADARPAYHRYRQTLGLIAGGNRNRWVLKDPHHVWFLPALLDVFPDACVVMTHRDPVDSISSTVNGYSQFRFLCEPAITMSAIGAEIFGNWSRAVDRAERQRAVLDPARILDIHIDDINADPAGTIERIYAYFKLPVTAEARAAWQQGPRETHNNVRAAARFNPEDFGLTATQIRDGVGAYLDRFRRVEQTKTSKEKK